LYNNSKIGIDPSGFMAKDMYVISGGHYCSLENPISINPMKAPYTDSQISDIIAEAVNQVVSITTPNQPFTVKMRIILDAAIKYCLNHNRKSLLHVLDYIINLQGDKETRDGIIARLTFLLNDSHMEKILCGDRAIEWGELIQRKETFILDCFGMGSEKMIFTGSLATFGLVNYFRYSRPKEYMPVSLYIDEAQNFVNRSIFDILREGRKYKLSCILAMQDFAFLDNKMTRVLLNVGNIVSGRLGHAEASLISKELGMAVQDIQYIEKYHVAYLTPKQRGIAKAPRPPFVIIKETPRMVELQRKATPSWFTLESYQPA
ncbi:MAG: TraM recognition domain-containing protein, partial [Deltaproteobacteria bacterium]|nr:TraM recognition domain-containing protein [Deltaproteobacteria bacterium]